MVYYRQMKTLLVSAALCAVVSTAGAVEWKNVDAEHYLGGRKASAGYLQGKVVLVDRWGAKCPPCRALLPRVEELWQSFKAKPFVILGGHCEGWGNADAVKKLIRENKLSYPVYEGAGLKDGEPKFDAIPYLYVVDETGKVVYRGHSDRDATEAIVAALTDMEAPKDATQWKRFLDYELENLPCRASLRLAEFRKKFPKEAKEYAAKEKELKAIPNLQKAAELIAFAKKAKDPPAFGPKDKAKKDKYQKLVKDVISKCEAFKEHPDPRVAQEAKNALADLKWTQATF